MERPSPLDAIRVWLGLALCDSSLSYAEQTALEQLLSSTTGLTAAQREEAAALLHNPTEGQLAVDEAIRGARRLSSASQAVREDTYLATQKLAFLDRARLSSSEKTFLARLAEELRVVPNDGSRAGESDSGLYSAPHAAGTRGE